ncbi:hypothetical protein EDF77_1509 [Stenotrophomonas maltophilia]|uniref:hypothetical protein n=1 Tax=Stenotrophomonas chelatiphaga TaxID=517011 RepID=UPI000F9A2024|nr:hypothetical protein [Stenotrophomonas chelatiphaga]MCS4230155.1 hypothetical protein [Stenotrophomonas chelatiphaga]ROQ43745.1 hypothetical protein EDF77_1509 [Stenotrophomonas maltophilia]
MKKCLSALVFGALTVVAGSVTAQESDYAGIDAKTVAQIQKAPSQVPGDVVLAAIERRIWAGTHFSDNLVHPGGQGPLGKRDRMLGFASYGPFQGGHALFNCFGPGDRFTSTYSDCEGGGDTPVGRPIIGFVASVQLPGTMPLYRCYQIIPGKNNHFDSFDPNCEGKRAAVNEGVLGYMWL